MIGLIRSVRIAGYTIYMLAGLKSFHKPSDHFPQQICYLDGWFGHIRFQILA
jgi:hypothetical protein